MIMRHWHCIGVQVVWIMVGSKGSGARVNGLWYKESNSASEVDTQE